MIALELNASQALVIDAEALRIRVLEREIFNAFSADQCINI